MRMKNLVSAIAALTMSLSAFAVVANAETLYSQDYEAEGATADWTTGTSGRYDPILNTVDGNTYLTVNQDNRFNNGATVTSPNYGVSSATFTMEWDMLLASGNNNACTYTIKDSAGSSLLTFAGTAASTTWTINGATTVTLPGSYSYKATDTDGNLTWYHYKLTNSADSLFLTITDTAGNVVFEQTPITKLSTTGGVSTMSYATGRYFANIAVDNIVIRDVEDADLPSLASIDYTINYKLGEETISTVTGTDYEGVEITSEATITVDGTKYIVDEAVSMTLSADVYSMDVAVRAAEVYDIVINAIGDIEKNLVTATAVEGDAYAYYYNKYITDDAGNYYVTDATTFGVAGTATENVDIDIVYNLVEEDIIAVIEGEDLSKTGGSANLPTGTNLSGGKAQSVQRASTEALLIPINAPVDGKYAIKLAYYNADSKARGYDLYLDDASYTTSLYYESVNSKASGTYTLEVDLTAGDHTLYYAINYSLTPALDYAVVTLVEEATSQTITKGTEDAITDAYDEDSGEDVVIFAGIKLNFINDVTLTLASESEDREFSTALNFGDLTLDGGSVEFDIVVYEAPADITMSIYAE